MNKKGFTLQELLITMAIIGVIAAISAPLVAGLFPDENKLKYMKAYNTLTDVTSKIMNDTGLYWTEYIGQDERERRGLSNNLRPLFSPYNDDDNCVGTTKFPCIFSKFVNLQSEPVYVEGDELGDSTTTFTTADGIFWEFNTTFTNLFKSTITVNINVDPKDERADHNCVFDNNTCTKPNQYVFRIENDGSVYPADALGMVYLLNTATNSAKQSYDLASSVVQQAGSTDDLVKLQTALNTLTKPASKKTEQKCYIFGLVCKNQ